MKKRLWHPFALLFAGLVTVAAMWFGAGYCLGYRSDHPTPVAVASGLVGVGYVLGLGGLVAAALFMAAIFETFPDTKDTEP